MLHLKGQQTLCVAGHIVLPLMGSLACADKARLVCFPRGVCGMACKWQAVASRDQGQPSALSAKSMQHSTAKHSTAQHSTAQHSTAQHVLRD